MPSAPLRILIVDDSALYRKIVRTVVEQLPDVEVVGTATDGKMALERVAVDRPDVITLDLEMPGLDGLGVLRALSDRPAPPAAIMISAFTTEGAKTTNEALKLGAFDFVLKPTAGSPEESTRQIRADLAPKLEACRAARRRMVGPPAAPSASPTASVERMLRTTRALRQPPQVVAIGISTGGPAALHRVLPAIPSDFPCPIVIVQHMPPLFTKSLADDLKRTCRIDVVEGSDGLPLRPGQAIIAPGGRQMRVVRQGTTGVVQITDDPPERNCRPAVDYLFRSLADAYGSRVLAGILTGMGDDGTQGCRLLRARGATILAQDEATCVVYGMPRAVFEAGLVDEVLPLPMIAPRIVSATLQGAHA